MAEVIFYYSHLKKKQYGNKKEIKILMWILIVFAAAFFMPVDNAAFRTDIDATLDLTKWYAQEHVVLCLLPAFFIAGVIAVFVSQGAVLRYFGANAKKNGLPIWLLLFRGQFWLFAVVPFYRCFRVFTDVEQVWDRQWHFYIQDQPLTFLP